MPKLRSLAILFSQEFTAKDAVDIHKYAPQLEAFAFRMPFETYQKSDAASIGKAFANITHLMIYDRIDQERVEYFRKWCFSTEFAFQRLTSLRVFTPDRTLHTYCKTERKRDRSRSFGDQAELVLFCDVCGEEGTVEWICPRCKCFMTSSLDQVF
jgi:hypothetical protein